MNDVINKLQRLLSEDRVIPVIGAGFSSAVANLPGWNKLVELGFQYASDRNLDKDLIARGEKYLNENQLLKSSNILKEILHAPKFPFVNFINDHFGNPTIISDELVNSVLDLSTPIIMTTNYDTLLSTVNSYSNKMKYVHKQYQEVINSLKKDEEIIIHLHGIYDRPDTIILSEQDYIDLNKNVGYKALLQKIISDYHLLFIGCSKDGVMDEDFLPIFNFIKEYFPYSSNQHFILLHEKELKNKNHIPLLTECNVETIVYGNEYSLLGEFINKINPNFDKKQVKLKKLQESYKEELERIAVRTNNFSNIKSEVDDFFVSNFKNKFDWVSSEKLQVLEKVLYDYNKNISDKREKLLFSQSIIKSIFNTSELKEKVDLWSIHSDNPEKLNPLNYISTAMLAYDCLLKIPKELIEDIRQSNNWGVFHNGFYNDYLGSFIREINAFKKLGVNLEEVYKDDKYLFENLKRIIQSLKNFLELDAKTFYMEVENATINNVIPKKFLVIATDESITLRNENDISIVYAKLPLNKNLTVSKVEVISLENKILIFGIDSNSCFYWNPSEDIFMNKIYSTHKYSINDLVIQQNANEIVVYIKVNNQLVVLKNFVEENKINMTQNFKSIIKYSDGFLSLRSMDSYYKGDILYKVNFVGNFTSLFTVDSLVDELKKNSFFYELIDDFEKNNPFGKLLNLIDVKELYKIENSGNEIVILRSSFLSVGSVLFIFELIEKELVLKELIHLKHSVCFCLDYFIQDNNLHLACGYLNMNGNEILCESIVLDKNHKIQSNKLFKLPNEKAEFETSDTLGCYFLDADTIILNIEGKKILTFSITKDFQNEFLLKNINAIKFYNQ